MALDGTVPPRRLSRGRDILTLARRDAGAVDRSGLENRSGRQATGGSNPSPSATLPLFVGVWPSCRTPADVGELPRTPHSCVRVERRDGSPAVRASRHVRQATMLLEAGMDSSSHFC